MTHLFSTQAAIISCDTELYFPQKLKIVISTKPHMTVITIAAIDIHFRNT